MLALDENLGGPFLLNPVPIADAHVHVGSWPEFGLDFQLEDLEAIMAQYGYSGSVVTPALVGDPLVANIGLRRQVMGDQRFYMFAWVGPYRDADLENWVYSNIGDHAVRGMKFHASISQCGIYDSRMEPFLGMADRARLPFLYHAGRTPISWPDKLMAVAPSYPGARFVMAHLGGNAYDRITDTLRRWPTLPENVWAESSTARHPDLLVRAIAQWGEDRVLFGSDLPFTDQRLNFDCLGYAGVSDDEAFMGANLYTLLKP